MRWRIANMSWNKTKLNLVAQLTLLIYRPVVNNNVITMRKKSLLKEKF